MFETIERSWGLLTESLSVLMREKRLLWFPVLSTIATLAVSASFLLPIYGVAALGHPVSPEAAKRNDSTTFAIWFVFYFVNYFITIFFNAALVAAAERTLEGDHATVGDGLRMAASRVGRIAYWALLATTVALLLSLIRRRAGAAGRAAAGFLGIAWSLITYFVVPVIVFEDRPVWQAIDRSTTLCRQGWGEAATGGIGFGAVWFLLSIPALVVIYAGVISHSTISVAGALLYLLLLATVSSTTKGIFTAALYRYAAHAQGPNWFANDLLSGAFAPSRGRLAAADASRPPIEGTVVEVSVIPLEKDLERGEMYLIRVRTGAEEYHAKYTLDELSSAFRADVWQPGTAVKLRVAGHQVLISGPGCDGVWCRFTTAAANRAL